MNPTARTLLAGQKDIAVSGLEQRHLHIGLDDTCALTLKLETNVPGAHLVSSVCKATNMTLALSCSISRAPPERRAGCPRTASGEDPDLGIRERILRTRNFMDVTSYHRLDLA